jgi:endonuclease/exonuclease/phosphatase (EEP) superfamily protein YafD
MAATGARRHWLIWVPVVPVALWALIRTTGLDSGFPLVALMAFTPYVAIAALFVAGVAVALRNWAAATAAALATFCLAVAVLPRAIGDGTASAAGHETLSILSANVHIGTADPKALVELVDRYDPDLLAIQELTPSLARKLRTAGFDTRFPHTIVEVPRRASGAGIYSTLPIRPLADGLPSFLRQPRAAVRLPDGRVLRFIDVHPLTPGRTGLDAWNASLRDLPRTGTGAPWVLVGDFNATLDHARLRDVLERGYRDAGDVAGEGLEPTWPAGRRFPPLITIDHVLADERLGIVDYGVDDLPGSDHRAVHAVLALP